MSDFEQVQIDPAQFSIIEKRLNGFRAQAQIIAERLGPVDTSKSIQQSLEKGFKDLNNSITAGFKMVAEALTATTLPPPQIKPLEVRFMFVVKDDHEPVNFSLTLGEVTDAEGQVIADAQLDVAVESSDPNVVAVDFKPFDRNGSISFGAPGVASLTATVKSGDTLLGSGAADFTVTVGNPAAISNVGLTFDGLTEVSPEPTT